MSEYLEEAKRLRAITEIHYNCCQSVVVPFAEKAGISAETAYACGANFGAGMGIAATCGAITGALMVLGLCGVDDPSVSAEFFRRVKAKHEGCTNCADLLRINKEKGTSKKEHCDGMVFELVEIAEELLRENGK